MSESFEFYNQSPVSEKELDKLNKNKNDNFDPHSMKNRIPVLYCLGFFLIGLLGLNIFSIFVQLIIQAINPSIDTINLVAYTNFFAYLLTSICMVVFAYFAFKKAQAFDSLKLGFTKGRNYGLGVLTYFMSMAILSIWSIVTYLIYTYTDLKPNVNANQSTLEVVMSAQPVLTFITVVVFGPFVEEMAYRLGLFECVRRKNRILAYVISGLVFGLLHFDFANCFTDPETQKLAFNSVYFLNELINLPSYVISGLVFAYAYDRFENISIPIVAHVTNNIIAASMMLLQPIVEQTTSFLG